MRLRCVVNSLRPCSPKATRRRKLQRDLCFHKLNDYSTNCTRRWRHCVRTPLLSEPLSSLICTRSISPCSLALSPCHHAASVSTMKSLVLEELPKVTYSCAVSSSTIPHG